MGAGRGTSSRRGVHTAVTLAFAASAACGPQGQGLPSADTILRVGVAQLSASANAIGGLHQLSQNLSLEVLARVGEDGRMQPALAESWHSSDDGRTLTVKLRQGVRFSDGSPFDAATAAKILPDALRNTMGPLYEDVQSIEASGNDTIRIAFHRASMLHQEAWDATVSKPGTGVGIGTGAYTTVPNSTTELRSNPDYYLGRPTIDRIAVSNYPSVRAAWAEALRGNLDMLYEVSPDALSSLERSKTVSTFTFTRRYQNVIILNARAPALSSRETRRTLNAAVDRVALVRDALRGHGISSSGPVWPQHWALSHDGDNSIINRVTADDLLRRVARQQGRLSFTCLTPPSDELERIALEVKRQLATIGIDMRVESVSQDDLFRRGGRGDYEAILTELISGPTLVRPYIVWLSKSPFNWGKFGNSTVDAALERLRNATGENAYREAVAGLQSAFTDDPPAIFLSWSVRARAVSTRFLVPETEAGRDVLSTLRFWKPVATDLRVSRN
jgi:peptide/nickel transport system substrate-binding protein